jgi:hypothetical protein
MPGSVIVAGVRTPVGRVAGSLRDHSAVGLSSLAIAGAVRAAGLDGGDVDAVVMGSAVQAGAAPTRRATRRPERGSRWASPRPPSTSSVCPASRRSRSQTSSSAPVSTTSSWRAAWSRRAPGRGGRLSAPGRCCGGPSRGAGKWPGLLRAALRRWLRAGDDESGARRVPRARLARRDRGLRGHRRPGPLPLRPAGGGGPGRVAACRRPVAVRDVDLLEINEAFAGVVLASMRELAVGPDRVYVNGGGLALGLPLGMTGACMVLTLALERADAAEASVSPPSREAAGRGRPSSCALPDAGERPPPSPRHTAVAPPSTGLADNCSATGQGLLSVGPGNALPRIRERVGHRRRWDQVLRASDECRQLPPHRALTVLRDRCSLHALRLTSLRASLIMSRL